MTYVRNDTSVARSPVNKSVDDIIAKWTSVKDPTTNVRLYPTVRRVWEGGFVIPPADQCPAILIGYMQPKYKVGSVQFFVKERPLTLRCFLILHDLTEDHKSGFGLTDLMEDYTRYALKMLEHPEQGSTAGLVPTPNRWSFASEQEVNPQLVKRLEGFDDTLIEPPFFCNMFDIRINVKNHEAS